MCVEPVARHDSATTPAASTLSTQLLQGRRLDAGGMTKLTTGAAEIWDTGDNSSRGGQRAGWFLVGVEMHALVNLVAIDLCKHRSGDFAYVLISHQHQEQNPRDCIEDTFHN